MFAFIYKIGSWHVTHQEVPQFAKLKGHSYLDDSI